MRARNALAMWENSARPVPAPHIVKQRIILAYHSAFGTETMVETGTYQGDMVYAMKDSFKNIYSIELSEQLYDRAKLRFRDFRHVQILHGDSGEVLPQILSSINTRCLFWLDGHYSAGFTAKASIETPIMKELATILAHRVKGHVILIDDARCFDGTHDYPTLAELRKLVEVSMPGCSFWVSNDVIRIHPDRTIESQY